MKNGNKLSKRSVLLQRRPQIFLAHHSFVNFASSSSSFFVFRTVLVQPGWKSGSSVQNSSLSDRSSFQNVHCKKISMQESISPSLSLSLSLVFFFSGCVSACRKTSLSGAVLPSLSLTELMVLMRRSSVPSVLITHGCRLCPNRSIFCCLSSNLRILVLALKMSYSQSCTASAVPRSRSLDVSHWRMISVWLPVLSWPPVKSVDRLPDQGFLFLVSHFDTSQKSCSL